VKANREPNKKARSILLAGLGKRLNTLARRNPAWGDQIFAKNTPEALAAALQAYRELESSKILAVNAYAASGHPPGNSIITFSKAFSDQGGTDALLWNDFATMAHIEKANRPVRAWEAGTGSDVRQVFDPEHARTANVITYALSPDQQLLLRGTINDAAISEIKNAKNWNEINGIAQKYDLSVFLSRTGSKDVGVCRVATRH